ncbi:MAG: HEPN domain-containing protein [Candidatus Helarchaeota archaeon]
MPSDLLKDFAIKLIKEAESDLESAEMQLKDSRYHKAVFESQQCVKKMMKAAIALEGLTQIYHRDPTSLFVAEIMTRVNNNILKDLRIMIREIDWLMEQYSHVRYPIIRSRRVISPIDLYKKDDAVEAINIAKNVVSITKKLLKEYYDLQIP